MCKFSKRSNIFLFLYKLPISINAFSHSEHPFFLNFKVIAVPCQAAQKVEDCFLVSIEVRSPKVHVSRDPENDKKTDLSAYALSHMRDKGKVS